MQSACILFGVAALFRASSFAAPADNRAQHFTITNDLAVTLPKTQPDVQPFPITNSSRLSIDGSRKCADPCRFPRAPRHTGCPLVKCAVHVPLSPRSASHVVSPSPTIQSNVQPYLITDFPRLPIVDPRIKCCGPGSHLNPRCDFVDCELPTGVQKDVAWVAMAFPTLSTPEDQIRDSMASVSRALAPHVSRRGEPAAPTATVALSHDEVVHEFSKAIDAIGEVLTPDNQEMIPRIVKSLQELATSILPAHANIVLKIAIQLDQIYADLMSTDPPTPVSDDVKQEILDFLWEMMGELGYVNPISDSTAMMVKRAVPHHGPNFPPYSNATTTNETLSNSTDTSTDILSRRWEPPNLEIAYCNVKYQFLWNRARIWVPAPFDEENHCSAFKWYISQQVGCEVITKYHCEKIRTPLKNGTQIDYIGSIFCNKRNAKLALLTHYPNATNWQMFCTGL